MLNSNERMGFIIEYMSSYDEKIKMANKNGIFDDNDNEIANNIYRKVTIPNENKVEKIEEKMI